MPPGYTLVEQFTADVLGHSELLGYLMTSASDAVLAFRGTDDFPDDIADSRFNQAPYPFDSNAGLTHVGFTDVYASCRDAVIAGVSALPAGIMLYITGHSLGGAVATLAALDVAVNTPLRRPIIYTIASPRVGDPNAASHFAGRLITSPLSSWRVVNMFDIVPLLPPEDIFDPFDNKQYKYKHVTDCVLIGFLKGGAIANHRLENYIEVIEQFP